MNIFKKFVNHFRNLPEKKRYLEFITALLTIPVLLSVIILNYSNLRKEEETKESEKETPTVVTIVQEREKTNTASPTERPECSPEVGPVSIRTPEEGEVITANPLTISLEHTDLTNEYCSIVWSYRINGGPWSNYDDRDISVYNMASGEKNLEVRVKSVRAGGEEITLKRTFTYQNTSEVPTAPPTNTPSPTLTPTPSPTTVL